MAHIGFTGYTRSADPTSNVYFTRRRVNEAFLEGLLEEFHKNGAQIIHRAGQENPATFLKVLAQLVPRELSVEHSASILGKLSDEQLGAMIAALDQQIQEALARENGEKAKVIEAVAEPTPERDVGTLGWRKPNPKTPPHQLAKARERARRRAEVRKAERVAKQAQVSDCTENGHFLHSHLSFHSQLRPRPRLRATASAKLANIRRT